MAGWRHHQGRAILLPLENIDTDQLIPARFMSTPRAQGYGRFLLHDLRRGADGALDPGFALNSAEEASVLIAGRNFGSGSSREAAVYALVDSGFRAVIAPSFGDIFAANAVNNGLLPARVSDEAHARLTERNPETVEIDLAERAICAAGARLPFVLDEGWRTKLINGWDDIDLTRHHSDAIAAFAAKRRDAAPWAWPAH